jgi:hypothetical protein
LAFPIFFYIGFMHFFLTIHFYFYFYKGGAGLLQSQVVAGGLAVLLLGWLFAHVRTGAALIADYLTQKVVVSGSPSFLAWPPCAHHAPRHTIHSAIAPPPLLPVEVTQREEAFDWILQWLAQQPKSSFASHNYRHMLFLLSVCASRVVSC